MRGLPESVLEFIYYIPRTDLWDCCVSGTLVVVLGIFPRDVLSHGHQLHFLPLPPQIISISLFLNSSPLCPAYSKTHLEIHVYSTLKNSSEQGAVERVIEALAEPMF